MLCGAWQPAMLPESSCSPAVVALRVNFLHVSLSTWVNAVHGHVLYVTLLVAFTWSAKHLLHLRTK